MSKGPQSIAPGDQVRVSVTVRLGADAAFALFTGEIDRWWRRGPKFRNAGARSGLIHLEPGVGGRLFESIETDNGTIVVEVGRVTVWEAAKRLVFSWRSSNFAPHESTEVEVAFQSVGAGTTVTVTHRGWSTLPSDHPVRHGLESVAFCRMMGLWWGDQMSSLRELAGQGRSR